MESHVLNPSFHQARYRPIGHKVLRSKSDSYSSESSCNQNSPEYPTIRIAQRSSEVTGVEWTIRNEMIKAANSSRDSSSDGDSSDAEQNDPTASQPDEGIYSEPEQSDDIEVCEVNVDENDNVDDDYEAIQSLQDIQITEGDDCDDHSLIEGHDYEIITVYTVNPDVIYEPSSDDDYDEEGFCVSEKGVSPNDDDGTGNTNSNYQEPTYQVNLEINVDGPVVADVDEYFVKNEVKHDNENILDADEPVVKDVDEYFIKDNDKVLPNVDDYLNKPKVPEEDTSQFLLPSANVEELLDRNSNEDAEKKVKPESQVASVPDSNVPNVSLNESDLEILPQIENIKRFLLEDIPYAKFKHNQKSFSVPQSPMQNICMDLDESKTCLSLDDLSLDLSELSYDNEKDKLNSSGDAPRTLTDEDVNSFLITNKTQIPEWKPEEEDDFSHQDMELESTVISEPTMIDVPSRKMTSTPINTVFDYCIEKSKAKKDVKVEVEDFVDVESCNDTVIPVLEANNVTALLEQFEATEVKRSTNGPTPVVKVEDAKVKCLNKTSLTNGMRLQDAGVQLNKNKMRQILMPTPIDSTSIRRSQSPVQSDHDYCSPKKKKKKSLPTLKGGQSLLKPEVLSSNSRILNSRHRSCKSKKVVYHQSSDEETEDKKSKNKKVTKSDDIDFNKKLCVKPSVKPPVQSNCRKKVSPPHCAPDNFKDKSVIINRASKASDSCSQNGIKLTIKNKSKVILNCDLVSQTNKKVDKCGNSVSENTNNVDIKDKSIKQLDRHIDNVINSLDMVTIKEEPRPKDENFYTTLFSNKQDLQIPRTLKIQSAKRHHEKSCNNDAKTAVIKEEPQPKKKKLNFQEYISRRGISSNNSSTQVSPEAIFPDAPTPVQCKEVKRERTEIPVNRLENTTNKLKKEQAVFDPIKEASRKILMNSKKQKAEATRKRDEDIVMRKIPKVEKLHLQPLISDAEMMKIVAMSQRETLPAVLTNDKPQIPADCEEIILVSVGVNTDSSMFQHPVIVNEKLKSKSPPSTTATINFKIKKSEPILKQNVFDYVKRDRRSPIDEKKQNDKRIDKERYKGITATIKSVEKQVDTKISSNSLFASIQDVVMKKAPEDIQDKHKDRHSKSKSPKDRHNNKSSNTVIVRQYDSTAEHGEDKVILYLSRHRSKPASNTVKVQTNPTPEFTMKVTPKVAKVTSAGRKRNDSDMSVSDGSPVRNVAPAPSKKIIANETNKKPKEVREKMERVSKEKRSRSKDRYESKYRRRSRSASRGRRRRSRTRSRSRSHGRYRRYRRSDSPYKRKHRSRSPYHKRKSPIRREISQVMRSRSRSPVRPVRSEAKSKTSIAMAKQIPHIAEKKTLKASTPPLRKPTVSESSDTSSSSSSSASSSATSSSSSSSSSASSQSEKSHRSNSPRRDENYKPKYRNYAAEDRENNTPVEERRIVFVGRLEKDITKAHLRNLFSKFGPVIEVRLHSKEDGSRYGFVTYQRARDAWTAVEAANTFPQYDVGFGGRRAFCRQSYADLDGLEAKYTESAFHGVAAPPLRRNDDMSFEQMLSDMKKKLSQRKNDKKRED